MSESENQDKSVKASSPLVFISHDTRDAKLAEAFSQLLRSVSAGVLKSFRSSDKLGNQGIEYGVEWYPEIIKNIQSATDVVCLLTARSIDRPWILFEAGMAKGKLETPILGVALGVPLNKASSGPFAQFQNCGDDEDSLCKLVFQLVNRIPNSEPDSGTIKFQVGEFKKNIVQILEQQSNNVQGISNEEAEKENSSAKLFEEIKVMFQDLPSRIEKNLEGLPRQSRNKRKTSIKYIDKYFEDDLFSSKRSDIGLMIILGLFRDSKTPWIYDMGIDVLRSLKSDDQVSEKRRKLEEFVEIVHLSIDHPMIRDVYMDSEEEEMLYRNLPRVLLQRLVRYEF